MPAFRQVRDLPGWGTIFSPHVCFIRPDGAEEEALFRSRVEDVLAILRAAVLQGLRTDDSGFYDPPL